MATEFDLPCADCGGALVRAQLSRGDATETVAACPDCGDRYSPEAALERF